MKDALQEQADLVEKLENRIQALRAGNRALQGLVRRYKNAAGGLDPKEFTLKDRARTNEHNILVSAFVEELLELPTPYGGRVPNDKRLVQEILRTEALNLRRRYNLNSKSVASILNVSSGTVAAWFAMQSRGAY